jgi:hypothetical protein
MDFITIADTAWRLHRRLSSSGEDDDFANISGGPDSATAAMTTTTAAMQQQQGGFTSTSGSMMNGDEPRPLLSPSADAELFLLATNFLLCKSQSVQTCGPFENRLEPRQLYPVHSIMIHCLST